MTIQQSFIDNLMASIGFFSPEIAIVITFILAILADLLFKKSKNIAAYISIVGLVITGFLLGTLTGVSRSLFEGLIVVDPFSTFFKFLTLITTIIIVIMSLSYKELYKDDRKVGEYYAMLVGMTFGMFLLSSATNLITIYLAVEILSLSSYVLAGYTKEIRKASEASLKYVIYGSLSSGLMVYGMSLLYGATMTLDVSGINTAILSGNIDLFPVIVAGLLVLVGLGYKISAVPFHYWTPDVYEGAPVTITSFLSVASKAAGFAVFIRFFKDLYFAPGMSDADVWSTISFFNWQTVIIVISILTMTLGNFVALWQEDVKRLLAYSSIAHAGYLLMGVAVMSSAGITAILVYFFFYMLMNLGAFYIAQLVDNEIGSFSLNDYKGLGYRSPILAVLMTVFLISLTGLPPTAGFIGKFYIFAAVLDKGLIWFAVIGVINSVVSLFFYAKIFRNMFLRTPEADANKFGATPANLVLAVVLAFFTVLFGLYFTPIVNWAQSSVTMFQIIP
jgi:NADH-quinone oxidoreductase subunit N